MKSDNFAIEGITRERSKEIIVHLEKEGYPNPRKYVGSGYSTPMRKRWYGVEDGIIQMFKGTLPSNIKEIYLFDDCYEIY